MAKTFLKNISVFLFMLILFAGLANGISFVLTDTLFAFFGYPTFPAAANAANPLHVLIPAVFLYFSLPCITVFAPQAQFGIKKRLALLLECHGFFFMVQILFWAFFCYFTLHHSHDVLGFLLGYNRQLDKSLTAIFMPMVFLRLLPLFGMFFIWISLRTSLSVLNDEENKKRTENFVFSAEDGTAEAQNGMFGFMPKKIEQAFTVLEWGNVFILLCVLAMFMPLSFADYVPAVSTNPFIFLVSFLQYYLVRLYKAERRKCLFVLGTVLQIGVLAFALLFENLLYQIVFIIYFLSQSYAYCCLYRYGKNFFKN